MTNQIITDKGLILQAFMLSYDNDKHFVKISVETFNQLISTFDREQFICPVDEAIKYGQINNLQHYHDFFNSHNITHKIHQDSERDLYIAIDLIL
jgi:hypothetical protein